MDKNTQQELDRILESAEKCSSKGRLYVFEDYKSQISCLSLSCEEYDHACRKLSKILRV